MQKKKKGILILKLIILPILCTLLGSTLAIGLSVIQQGKKKDSQMLNIKDEETIQIGDHSDEQVDQLESKQTIIKETVMEESEDTGLDIIESKENETVGLGKKQSDSVENEKFESKVEEINTHEYEENETECDEYKNVEPEEVKNEELEGTEKAELEEAEKEKLEEAEKEKLEEAEKEKLEEAEKEKLEEVEKEKLEEAGIYESKHIDQEESQPEFDEKESQTSGKQEYINYDTASPEKIIKDFHLKKCKVADVKVTSVLEGNESKYGADHMIDGKLSTAWVEGADGVGEGESAMFVFEEKIALCGIKIANGYFKSEETFLKNGRMLEIFLEFSDGTYFKAYLDARYIGDTVEETKYTDFIWFHEPVYTEYVSIFIVTAEEGYRFSDTCVSEVTFYKGGQNEH